MFIYSLPAQKNLKPIWTRNLSMFKPFACFSDMQRQADDAFKPFACPSDMQRQADDVFKPFAYLFQ